jgi:CIC family chloride channel protein
MFGAITGLVVEPVLGETFSSLTPYVICGMVAVASPVIGAPLTTILIVFELARNYDLAVAAMISVVFANLVGYQLMGRSLFDIQLKLQGFDLTLGRDRVIMDSRDIAAYLSDDYIFTDGQSSLSSARQKLIYAQKSEIFIVDDTDKYLGSISLLDILSIERNNTDLERAQCGEHLSQPLVLYSSTSIWTAMELIQDFIGESIPVLSDERDRRLQGVVFESSVIKGYMISLHEIRKEEYGAD